MLVDRLMVRSPSAEREKLLSRSGVAGRTTASRFQERVLQKQRRVAALREEASEHCGASGEN
jgi:hypothetical protein